MRRIGIDSQSTPDARFVAWVFSSIKHIHFAVRIRILQMKRPVVKGEQKDGETHGEMEVAAAAPVQSLLLLFGLLPRRQEAVVVQYTADLE